MSRINVRAKGQRAEREAIKLLQPIVDIVCLECGKDPILLERNQQQSNRGGYDIIGLDWLALEIKHQEKLDVEAWWQQTLKQCGKDQIPVLFYKQNNVKWRVRIRGTFYWDGWKRDCPVEIAMDEFLLMFDHRVRIALNSR